MQPKFHRFKDYKPCKFIILQTHKHGPAISGLNSNSRVDTISCSTGAEEARIGRPPFSKDPFMTAVLLARLQFAFTISVHIIFPAFTIGLSAFIATLLIL